jgi:hypothetical protein
VPIQKENVMCLHVSGGKTQDFREVYPLDKQNYIEAKGRQTNKRIIHGGAIHVFLKEYRARGICARWEDDYAIKAWAPLDAFYGCDYGGVKAAFRYIILDDKDWDTIRGMMKL